MNRPHLLLSAGAVVVLAAGALAVTGLAGGGGATDSASNPNHFVIASNAQAPTGADALTTAIAGLQASLKTVPNNADAWSTLGLDYVEQARSTVDPSYYPKAEAALAMSLQLEPTDNFIAAAGQAALASGRHDFTAALSYATAGIAIDSYNAALYGAQADALTQLGRYDDAQAAVQKMLNVRPDTPAFSRASYVFELRGDVPGAIAQMTRARDLAAVPADVAFADYYLCELSFNAGDYATALAMAQAGLKADPTYAALYEGRAKAYEGLGMTDLALADFADVVNRVPQPQYLIEYGDLLTSLGRTADAQKQYDLFTTEDQLFVANGVTLDTDATLFEANHGDKALALSIGANGLKVRPFLEMNDADAWALHANGQDAAALVQANLALATGMQNALFHYHRGMIEKSMGQNAAAKTDLQAALQINPHFSPVEAPLAAQALAAL